MVIVMMKNRIEEVDKEEENDINLAIIFWQQ